MGVAVEDGPLGAFFIVEYEGERDDGLVGPLRVECFFAVTCAVLILRFRREISNSCFGGWRWEVGRGADLRGLVG